MHQDAADGVVQRAALLVLAHVRLIHDPHRSYIGAVKGEFRGVVQHQNQRAAAADSISRCLKVPAQNLLFVNARVGEKAVRRFGVSPVLTRPRNASPDVVRELFHQLV